ncbi:hypothetical protein I553_8685 [Mycobacterium xenopi 4042]|uniref:Uncharacterized protein n=1 Tax=Mycobacterium xenopi 4042 TaxID=1299334 RepID=X8CJT9_MYCXE|nr:hypothetical protein I552_8346 [Mycobacterium xenopi 3993]EUA56637.1 hypothetical protein I553_8685 [Mycobacterium xenopi 4042]
MHGCVIPNQRQLPKQLSTRPSTTRHHVEQDRSAAIPTLHSTYYCY